MEEEDKGHAEDHFRLIDDNQDDQNVTVSGVACPLPAKDTQEDLNKLLDTLLRIRGASQNNLNASSRVAHINLNYANGDAMKELCRDTLLSTL